MKEEKSLLTQDVRTQKTAHASFVIQNFMENVKQDSILKNVAMNVMKEVNEQTTLKWSTKMKEQMFGRPKRRCAHRGRRVAWCNLLGKFCDAPNEYETCNHYKPRK